MTQFERVDGMEERIQDALGTEEFLLSIIKALDYDTKEEIYEYICTCHDIEIGEED